MTWIQNGLAVACISGGILLMFFGSLGILRLPDFFCRSHASGKVDTLGIFVLLLGFAIHQGVSLNSGKLLLGALFVAIANPVAAHALARAALRVGLKPWVRPADGGEGGAP